jgi:hypothetical protein
MTDAAVDGVLPDAAVAVEVPDEAAPLEAVANGAPPDADVASPEPPQFDPRLEIPPSLGPVRRAILDALLDADEPLTVARLIAQMPPGTSRNVAESSIHRELTAGRIDRVSAGTYRLAPPPKPKPPEPSPPTADAAMAMVIGFRWPSDPAALAGMTEDQWFDALEAWYTDPSTWSLGPPPDRRTTECHTTSCAGGWSASGSGRSASVRPTNAPPIRPLRIVNCATS